jgi:hypothetical protein
MEQIGSDYIKSICIDGIIYINLDYKYSDDVIVVKV